MTNANLPECFLDWAVATGLLTTNGQARYGLGPAVADLDSSASSVDTTTPAPMGRGGSARVGFGLGGGGGSAQDNYDPILLSLASRLCKLAKGKRWSSSPRPIVWAQRLHHLVRHHGLATVTATWEQYLAHPDPGKVAQIKQATHIGDKWFQVVRNLGNFQDGMPTVDTPDWNDWDNEPRRILSEANIDWGAHPAAQSTRIVWQAWYRVRACVTVVERWPDYGVQIDPDQEEALHVAVQGDLCDTVAHLLAWVERCVVPRFANAKWQGMRWWVPAEMGLPIHETTLKEVLVRYGKGTEG